MGIARKGHRGASGIGGWPSAFKPRPGSAQRSALGLIISVERLDRHGYL